MARYYASPFGDILGKWGDTIGGKWRGIYWIRKRVYPTQRGTLTLYRLLKEGLISPERFSFKQMNIRRLVFQVLGWIGKTNLSTMTYPVWDKLCKKRKLRLTGTNLFVRRNAPDLWASIPNPDKEYNSVTNKPDMSKMLVSDGDLEATPNVPSVTYDPVTGKLTVNWDVFYSKNGSPLDIAYVLAYEEPLVDSQWRPNGWLHGKVELPTIVKYRGDGSMEVTLPTGLDADNLFGYVFFSDQAGIIGFSPSEGKKAVAV